MQNEPSEFRDRLLDAQPISPALRDEYRKALDGLLVYRLTSGTRWLTIGGLLVSVGFAVACIASLIVHRARPDVWIVLPAYATIFGAMSFWLIRVLKQGGFARRSAFAATELLGGCFVGVYVTAVLFRGMSRPSDPVSTYWAIWAVLLTMVGFAWGTGNRISASTLETREHLLRVESRLADLAERMQK